MKVSFNAVLIGVKDIVKSKVFYEKVFGVVFDEIRPPFSNFYLNGIEFMVEENTQDRSDNWEKDYYGTPKGFVFETDDIDTFLKNVEIYQGKIVENSKLTQWNSYEAKFADIDGNTFIIEQNI